MSWWQGNTWQVKEQAADDGGVLSSVAQPLFWPIRQFCVCMML